MQPLPEVLLGPSTQVVHQEYVLQPQVWPQDVVVERVLPGFWLHLSRPRKVIHQQLSVQRQVDRLELSQGLGIWRVKMFYLMQFLQQIGGHTAHQSIPIPNAH